ncbi:MAG: hypothetical protein AAFP69_22515, partial [Planctomycetota bacterium]
PVDPVIGRAILRKIGFQGIVPAGDFVGRECGKMLVNSRAIRIRRPLVPRDKKHRPAHEIARWNDPLKSDFPQISG